MGLREKSRENENRKRMTIRKLKFGWKHRKLLWKYRKLIRHRRAIGGAAVALGAAGVAAWLVLRGTSSPAAASNA